MRQQKKNTVFPETTETGPSHFCANIQFAQIQSQNGMSVLCNIITQQQAEILSPTQGGA